MYSTFLTCIFLCTNICQLFFIMHVNNSKKFINGKELIDTLPHDLKDMFIFLDENDFRVDVSSTEIRKQQQHDQNSD